MGTSSGTRFSACRISNATGSRDGTGRKSACASSGTLARAAFPRAIRSFGLGRPARSACSSASEAASVDLAIEPASFCAHCLVFPLLPTTEYVCEQLEPRVLRRLSAREGEVGHAAGTAHRLDREPALESL